MSVHVIVLPGGGYQMLTEHDGDPVVDWLTDLGHSAAVLRYPVGARHPRPLEAVGTAVRLARGEGHHRVGVLGFSAGGHLAGLAALSPTDDPLARPDFGILGYPIVSMETNVYPWAGDTLIGADASAALRQSTSLDRLVGPAAPPLFLWHTAEDRSVPVSETYRLAAALSTAGAPHDVHVFAHGPHSLGLARGAGGAEAWTVLAARWLAEVALTGSAGARGVSAGR